MKLKLLLCLALVLGDRLFAVELRTNDVPHELTNMWEYINFPFPTNAPGEPFFVAGSGAEWDQVSFGLRLDIMGLGQGYNFFKTNSITARLFRADGEILEPTAEGKQLLNAPMSVSTMSWPGEKPDLQVMTYFPWGSNVLEESWIEVTIASERYWLEIPYGFDCNPAGPLPAANSSGPPQFVPGMKSLTDHDHVVRWESVHYDLGKIQNGWRLMFIQSNPSDSEVETKVVLYQDPDQAMKSPWKFDSPRTSARIVDADGTAVTGHRLDVHRDDVGLERVDIFHFGRYVDKLRCQGRIEISVDDKTNNTVIPSSLYKYFHGHARL